jgi:hypothetical protein
VIDEKYDFEELEDVKIKIKAGSLKVLNTESEDDKVALKFYAEKEKWADVDAGKNSLKIEDKSDDCHFICFNWEGVKIELYLPAKYAGKLVIDTD